MLKSKITDYYAKTTQDRICQGDILINLKFSVSNTKDDTVTQHDFLLNYSVVMSQDCDLEQYYKNKQTVSEVSNSFDKYIPNILICPAYPSERFITGEHLDGFQMESFGNSASQQKTLEKIKRNNSFNRYHFLQGVSEKFPDLIIDFKHFYTIPTEILSENFKEPYLVTINELFRERLSQRFANYLSRFGLPDFSRNEDIKDD